MVLKTSGAIWLTAGDATFGVVGASGTRGAAGLGAGGWAMGTPGANFLFPQSQIHRDRHATPLPEAWFYLWLGQRKLGDEYPPLLSYGNYWGSCREHTRTGRCGPTFTFFLEAKATGKYIGVFMFPSVNVNIYMTVQLMTWCWIHKKKETPPALPPCLSFFLHFLPSLPFPLLLPFSFISPSTTPPPPPPPATPPKPTTKEQHHHPPPLSAFPSPCQFAPFFFWRYLLSICPLPRQSSFLS